MYKPLASKQQNIKLPPLMILKIVAIFTPLLLLVVVVKPTVPNVSSDSGVNKLIVVLEMNCGISHVIIKSARKESSKALSKRCK